MRMREKHCAKHMHIAQICVVIAIIVMLNFVTAELAQRYPLSLDLTANNRYALSEINRNFLSSLDKDIHIYVLAREEEYEKASSYTRYVHALLKQYPLYGSVSVEYVDYLRDPTFSANYSELDLSENAIIVECEGRAEVLQTSDLFEYSYSATNEIQVKAIGEAKLATAFTSVRSLTHAKAIILSGNNAQPLEGFGELLQANGFEVSRTNLALGSFDPEADLMILSAPLDDLTQEEISSIDSWIVNGGEYGKTFLYTADVTQNALPAMESYLKEWGISVDDGAVFETSPERTSQNQPFFATATITDSALISMLSSEDAPLIAPMARPLTQCYSFQENYTTQVMAEFSETSGVRPPDAPEKFSASDAVRRGPIPTMIRSTLAPSGKTPSQMIVCGSTTLLDSKIIQGNAYLNRKFLIKLFAGLGDGMDISNYVGKEITDESVHIPTVTAEIIGILLAFVLPAVLLAAGTVVFFRRRRL